MSIVANSFLFLVLGAVLTLVGGIALWLLKDRLMIFGNVLYWSEPTEFDGRQKVSLKDDAIKDNVTWQHVILHIKALNDRVQNVRIQFYKETGEIEISPRVPFTLSKDVPGELVIPQLTSGVYILSRHLPANTGLIFRVESVVTDNARVVPRDFPQPDLDRAGRMRKIVILIGLVAVLVLIAVTLATWR